MQITPGVEASFSEEGLSFITAAQVANFAVDYEGGLIKIEGEALAGLW